jgi:hypothetical protein
MRQLPKDLRRDLIFSRADAKDDFAELTDALPTRINLFNPIRPGLLISGIYVPSLDVTAQPVALKLSK